MIDKAIYTKDKTALLDNPGIPLAVLPTQEETFRSMADDMVDTIRERNAAGKRTVFIVPVGPVGQYPYFVQRVNEERISLKNVWFFNMDEYLDEHDRPIDFDSHLSFRGFMHREVYQKIRKELVMDAKQRIFPDPDHPRLLTETLERLGGADVCYGGLGINGHVAFNEPDEISVEEFKELKTRVADIAMDTQIANAIGSLNGALDAMPRRSVTIGFSEIYASRRIRLYCFRDWHRAVVRHAAHGPISTRFPVTILQEHPDCRITMSSNVAEPCW